MHLTLVTHTVVVHTSPVCPLDQTSWAHWLTPLLLSCCTCLHTNTPPLSLHVLHSTQGHTVCGYRVIACATSCCSMSLVCIPMVLWWLVTATMWTVKWAMAWSAMVRQPTALQPFSCFTTASPDNTLCKMQATTRECMRRYWRGGVWSDFWRHTTLEYAAQFLH